MNTDTLYHQYRNYFQAAGSGWQLGEDGRRLRSGGRQRHLALEMCVDGFGLRADAVAGEQVGYGVGFLAAERALAAGSSMRMVSGSAWVSLCQRRPPPIVQPRGFSGCVV
ncbi:hypothetical protein HMPREF9120_00846 [Neisseria sp. oral taxon 020 str. F0370]|uniref:hypothetical protein n=1 Tax=unclassified Neisseria TaxID=2623750 RepID=UPI0002A3711A|nr:MULTISPECIES: hypothetical protein [unclassified Neisseria]EKY07996.1 hypothetical protein HMPREF9120_00846 [Neisseria sp. oral taxon 020 str. F0370]